MPRVTRPHGRQYPFESRSSGRHPSDTVRRDTTTGDRVPPLPVLDIGMPVRNNVTKRYIGHVTELKGEITYMDYEIYKTSILEHDKSMPRKK